MRQKLKLAWRGDWSPAISDSPDLSPSIQDDRRYLRFPVFISRQNLGQSGSGKIPDRLGFSPHMKRQQDTNFDFSKGRKPVLAFVMTDSHFRDRMTAVGEAAQSSEPAANRFIVVRMMKIGGEPIRRWCEIALSTFGKDQQRLQENPFTDAVLSCLWWKLVRSAPTHSRNEN